MILAAATFLAGFALGVAAVVRLQRRRRRAIYADLEARIRRQHEEYDAQYALLAHARAIVREAIEEDGR